MYTLYMKLHAYMKICMVVHDHVVRVVDYESLATHRWRSNSASYFGFSFQARKLPNIGGSLQVHPSDSWKSHII